jgi:hypothetical protein
MPKIQPIDDRERALTLARSGDYVNWQGVCRRMMFDGFEVTAFTDEAFGRR